MDEKKEVIGGVMFGEVLPPERKVPAKRKASSSSMAARPRREAKAISTDLQVKGAKAGVHRVTGAVGLYLQVGETGSASWFYRFRLGGKRHEMGIGSRDRVTLADARKKARAADVLRDQGVNPIGARNRERAENIAKFRAEARGAFTFEQMVERFLDLNAPGWKGNYARANWHGSIKLHAYPVIGDVGLDQITVEHAFAVIDRAMAKAGKPTARRLRSKCEQVIDMARARGLRNRDLINPFDAKLIKLPKQWGDRPHYRSVNFDDAQAVFQWLKAFVEQHQRHRGVVVHDLDRRAAI
jgi:Arm DNA-binding domain